MANVNQVSPDGGTTLYDIEDTPVRSSIARTEDGTSPSATINAGEEFYHLNVLYKATQDIATTDTITPNSNCEVSPSVTSQIAQKADKSDLGTASSKNSTSVVTDSSDLVESGAVYDALQGKADNSVIGTVEDGATASQAYAVGSHAIRNGAFITWKNAKAQNETINDASDYTSGDVADELTAKSVLLTPSGSLTLQAGESRLIVTNGIANLSFQLGIPSGVTLSKGTNNSLFTFDSAYAPKSTVYGIGLTNVEKNPIFSRLGVTSSGSCTCRVSADIVGVKAIQGSLSWVVGN